MIRTIVQLCLFFMLIAILGGCASIQFGQLERNESVTKDEAIVVLGVTPRARITITEGEIAEGVLYSSSFLVNAVVWPENNFIVLKLKPRIGKNVYMVRRILPYGLFGSIYEPRRGALLPAFRAQSGKVMFVGAISLVRKTPDDDLPYYTIERDNSVTMDYVRNYILSNYPNLPKEIVFEPYEMISNAFGL